MSPPLVPMGMRPFVPVEFEAVGTALVIFVQAKPL
jgi:hypothetical protein